MTIQQDIDKLFKHGLSDYAEKPPGFVWGGIEQSLNKRRIRRRRNIMYSVAASVAIVLSFGAGYLLTGFQSNNLMVENVPTQNFDIEKSDNSKINDNTNIDNKNNADLENNTLKSVEKNNTNSESRSLNNSPKQELSKSEDQNVKKVKSSGMLLPPIFASADEFESDKVEFIEENIEQEAPLNTMKMKDINLVNESENSDVSILFNSKKTDVEFNNYQNSSMSDYAFSDKPVEKTDLWSIGMAATPLMSYRDVVDVSQEDVLNADINTNYTEEYNNEQPLTSYSVGVNVGYKIAKRWKIQSGLYMSELGQISENVALYDQSAYVDDKSSYYINTSTGNIEIQGSPNELISRFSETSNDNNILAAPQPKGPDMYGSTPDLQANFIQSFEYIEVPVIINYTVIDRKLSMNVSGGLSANFLYDNSTYIVNEGSRYDLDAESGDLKNMNYSGVVGLGLEYPIITKLRINLQPTFRYSLNSINNSGTVYPYSFGVYTGLKYNF